jgi:hypothetical protein
LIGFFVGLETMHTARDAHAAERFAPGDGIRLVAGRRRKSACHFCPAADKAVNLFFDVHERLFHVAKAYAFDPAKASGAKSIGLHRRDEGGGTAAGPSSGKINSRRAPRFSTGSSREIIWSEDS